MTSILLNRAPTDPPGASPGISNRNAADHPAKQPGARHLLPSGTVAP